MPNKDLWEILVPTEIEKDGRINPVRVRYHKVWDGEVRKIAGGLTILKPAVGHWVSPDDQLFIEKMIPVRICCTKEEIDKIADMTALYYGQSAVMYYKISEEVYIKSFPTEKYDSPSKTS